MFDNLPFDSDIVYFAKEKPWQQTGDKDGVKRWNVATAQRTKQILCQVK